MSTTVTETRQPGVEDAACYQQNLAALRERQPAVADRIESVPIPSGVARSTGRDGLSTFQLTRADGTRAWMGQSSMPSISAQEVFAEAAYRGGNAAIPGVLTGLEPLVLLDRFHSFAALFVLEDEPLYVKLAFHLYDYSEVISAGRLVFILTEAFGEGLTDLIRRYPGYEMPTHLYHVPQRSAAQLADLQRDLERAGQAAVDVQTQYINDSVKANAGHACNVLPEAPRVALLSSDSRPGALRQVRRVARALESLGWNHIVSAPTTPQECHAVARLRAIERLGAEIAIFVNDGAKSVRGALPQNFSAVSWSFDETGVRTVESIPLGPRDVFVSSGADSDAINAAAKSLADQFLPLAPAADDVAFPASDTCDSPQTLSVDVAIPCDLPDDRAEACGVHLHSHIKLWSKIIEIASRCIDRDEETDAEGILSRAEQATGVGVTEETVREWFVKIIRHRAIPAAIGRSLAHTCNDVGLSVAVFGANWNGLRDENIRLGGEIPEQSGENALFDAAKVIVLPSCGVGHVQAALDSLARRKPVCIRAKASDFTNEFSELTELADCVSFAPRSKSVADLMRTVLRGVGNKDARSDESNLRTLLARHTVKARLQSIMARVRKLQQA